MVSPFGEDAGRFQEITPFSVLDVERGVVIRLADGLGGDIRDDLNRKFNRSIEYEFQKNRIWIPCFVSWEEFSSSCGERYISTTYTNIYCLPRDTTNLMFGRQFQAIFGRAPRQLEIERFWGDVCAAVGLFIESGREAYERSAPNPMQSHLVVFDDGDDGGELNWRDVAKRALSVIHTLREVRDVDQRRSS